MKLRNKETGEIGEVQITEKHCAVAVGNGTASCGIEIYSSLAELNAEWEDAPEKTKEWWYTDCDGEVYSVDRLVGYNLNKLKEIGNYFDTREEAEKAVEKLKAWKRLKDKKIFIWLDHFDYRSQDGSFNVEFEDNLSSDELNQVNDDLDLLFGGEE